MTEHTPGPWVPEQGDVFTAEYDAFDGEKTLVAQAYGHTSTQRRDNASLIAASPRLRVALKRMIAELRSALPPNPFGEGSWLDTMPGMDDPVAEAEDAIAEAEGGEMTEAPKARELWLTKYEIEEASGPPINDFQTRYVRADIADEMLRELKEFVSHYEDGNQYVARLCAAIAKAEGK